MNIDFLMMTMHIESVINMDVTMLLNGYKKIVNK